MGKIWEKYGKMLGLSTLEAFFHIFPYFSHCDSTWAPKISGNLGGFTT
jgi:hypothetical protein